MKRNHKDLSDIIADWIAEHILAPLLAAISGGKR